MVHPLILDVNLLEVCIPLSVLNLHFSASVFIRSVTQFWVNVSPFTFNMGCVCSYTVGLFLLALFEAYVSSYWNWFYSSSHLSLPWESIICISFVHVPWHKCIVLSLDMGHFEPRKETFVDPFHTATYITCDWVGGRVGHNWSECDKWILTIDKLHHVSLPPSIHNWVGGRVGPNLSECDH